MSPARPALCAVAVAVAVAGCSGGGDGRSPASPSASSGLGADEFVPTVVDAMVEAGTAHLVLDVRSGGRQELSAEGDLRVGDPARPEENDTAFTIRGRDGGELELRTIDGQVYANLGEATDGKFVTAEVSDRSSKLVQAFGSTRDASIVEQTEQLQEAVTDVRAAGPGPTLDGVATTEHVLSIDPARYPGQLAQPARRLDRIDYHFYLDRQRRPLRIEIRLPGTLVRTDASDWGGPVAIEEPSRREITTRDPFA